MGSDYLLQLAHEGSQNLIAGVQAPAHCGTSRDGFLISIPCLIQKVHVLHEGGG